MTCSHLQAMLTQAQIRAFSFRSVQPLRNSNLDLLSNLSPFSIDLRAQRSPHWVVGDDEKCDDFHISPPPRHTAKILSRSCHCLSLFKPLVTQSKLGIEWKSAGYESPRPKSEVAEKENDTSIFLFDRKRFRRIHLLILPLLLLLPLWLRSSLALHSIFGQKESLSRAKRSTNGGKYSAAKYEKGCDSFFTWLTLSTLSSVEPRSPLLAKW